MRVARESSNATFADLAALADERFHEVLDGELTRKTEPTAEHGSAQLAFGQLFRPFNRRPGGRWPGGWWFASEVEIELAPSQIVRPDVAGWRRDHVGERPSGAPVRARPDWLCEIVSTANPKNDLVKKRRLYHRAGVPHYWIVDPRDETLSVHRWHPDGYLLVLTAERGDRVCAEPFDAIELQVGVLFGDDEDEAG